MELVLACAAWASVSGLSLPSPLGPIVGQESFGPAGISPRNLMRRKSEEHFLVQLLKAKLYVHQLVGRRIRGGGLGGRAQLLPYPPNCIRPSLTRPYGVTPTWWCRCDLHISP